MTVTSPRLVNWENGTDLVIELPLAASVSTVWSGLTDRKNAGSWFAPFTITATAEEANPTISLDLGETQLEGQILSVEEEDHILVELEDFGVLGFQLLALELTDGDATLLVFTQSAADLESARLKAADFGPMWDTHLRLFARSLGLEAVEADEAELLATYADLELEDSREGGEEAVDDE